MNSNSPVSFSLVPRFLAGERVLYSQPWLWAVSAKSLPSYRISLGIPLVQDISLYVTDQRVLLCGGLFRLLRVDWAAWFGVEAAGADQDRVTEVSVGRMRLFGHYLQLMTHNAARHWWRSPEARVRLFMRNAEPLCRLLEQQLRMPGSKRAVTPGGAPATGPYTAKPRSVSQGIDRSYV